MGRVFKHYWSVNFKWVPCTPLPPGKPSMGPPPWDTAPPGRGPARVQARVSIRVYERELLPRYRVGTCLLYRMDTYHRGTPVFKDTMRRVWGAVWRRGDSG